MCSSLPEIFSACKSQTILSVSPPHRCLSLPANGSTSCSFHSISAHLDLPIPCLSPRLSLYVSLKVIKLFLVFLLLKILLQRNILVHLTLALTSVGLQDKLLEVDVLSKCILFYDGFCQIAVQKGCTLFTRYENLFFTPFSVLGSVNVFHFCQFDGLKKTSGFNLYFFF